MTALDMWDISDEKKRKAEKAEIAQMKENTNMDEIAEADEMAKADEIAETDETINIDIMSSPAESVIEFGCANPERNTESKQEDDWTDLKVNVNDGELTQMSKHSGFVVVSNMDEVEQEEELYSAKKLVAMQKETDPFDSLKARLAAWGDVRPPNM